MGHSRQDGGYAEAPQAALEGLPVLPETARAGLESLRPDLGQIPAFTPFKPVKPPKSEAGIKFEIVSPFEPKGDQPTAIAELVKGTNAEERDQVLLGVTGSGKTFTVAQIIERTQRPALILAPNKTLAAQLYGEFQSFFPNNAVEYFVSYYDYYTPEAYVARSDTYIEKESAINEQIDRMRHSATRALLERDDVIVVASVSCIYGIGDVETYSAMTFAIKKGQKFPQRQLINDLVALHYKRNDQNFVRGTFRVRGDSIELFPSHLDDRAWRLSLFGDEVESITEFDPLTGQKNAELEQIKVYSNSHYVTPKPTLDQAVRRIKDDLRLRLSEFNAAGRILESQRLEQRTMFDIEMMMATGSCAALKTIRAISRAANPVSHLPHCLNICPTMRWCSSMKAMSPCHRSVACSKATFHVKPRWPNMVSGFPPASITVRCALKNGTPCARKRSMFQPRRGHGN